LADTHGYTTAWLALCSLTALGIAPALYARRLMKLRPTTT
jgi:hypothetical protein